MENEILKNLSPISSWKNDSKTLTANTKTTLVSSDIPIRMVRVYSPTTNTGIIYAGSESLSITNATLVLNPGIGVDISIDNLKKVFVIGSVTNDVAAFSYVLA